VADRADRIEEIRAAVGRCSRPEPGTSEWHRRELLDMVDDLTSPEPEPRLPVEHEVLSALRVKVTQAVDVSALREDIVRDIDRAMARMAYDAVTIERRWGEVVSLSKANASLAMPLAEAIGRLQDAPAPLDLTLYIMSAEESFDLEEPVTPPRGHGVLVLCAPMDTIRTLADEEPHAVRVGLAWGKA